MDFTLLKYFYAVAKEGSFMAAAEKLNYAQSNLSMRIKQLEKWVGAELFIRRRNGVILTEKGRILYAYAERILMLSKEAEFAVRDQGFSTHTLTIAAMESAAVTFLPAKLARYHDLFPKISVRVKTGTSDAGLKAVLESEADAAIAVGKNINEELESIFLKKEKLVLMAAESTPEEADIKKLFMQPLLVFPTGCAYRKVLERMLADFGLAPEKMMEFTSLGAILASVSAGLGVSLLPEAAGSAFTAGNSLRVFSLPEEYETADIYLVFRKNSLGNKTLSDFIEVMKGDCGHQNE